MDNLLHTSMAPLFFTILILTFSGSESFTQTNNNNHGLLLTLSHALSTTNTTSPTQLLHLLKTTTLHSAARFRSRRQRASHKQQANRFQRRQVSLSLNPGSDYTLSLSLSPTTTVQLYMDTGSDLVWFPCAPFECILCEDKPKPPSPPPPPPRNSSFLSCAHPSCSAAHSSLSSSDLCAMAGCSLDDLETNSCPATATCPPLYYAYGDGSLIAKLRRGPLLLPTAPNLGLKNFTFGCAHVSLAEPLGVAGFGQGILSLPAQLASLSPGLGSKFSYCLVSHSFQSNRLAQPSPLILGRTAGESPGSTEPVIYTPMLPNPKHSYFYLVSLESITIGGTRIPAEESMTTVDSEGNGGVVVDSGTTYTMLPETMHAKVKAEFDKKMIAAGYSRAEEVEADTSLSPCYYSNNNNTSKNETFSRVPAMELNFGGGATVGLRRKNYFLGFQRKGKRAGCLMLMSDAVAGSDDSSGGPAATLGNFQQQGMEVVYDIEGKRVGFARRRCAALWDSLAHSG